jgi:hypothetical protein
MPSCHGRLSGVAAVGGDRAGSDGGLPPVFLIEAAWVANGGSLGMPRPPLGMVVDGRERRNGENTQPTHEAIMRRLCPDNHVTIRDKEP